jgi:hypothetical protein
MTKFIISFKVMKNSYVTTIAISMLEKLKSYPLCIPGRDILKLKDNQLFAKSEISAINSQLDK